MMETVCRYENFKNKRDLWVKIPNIYHTTREIPNFYHQKNNFYTKNYYHLTKHNLKINEG